MLSEAHKSNAVLLTYDKDFGEIVFRLEAPHFGVILLRLSGMPPQEKINTLTALLAAHGEVLTRRFTVLSKRGLRIRAIRD